MTNLSYKTAGESHGPALLTIVEGLPAGLRFDADLINLQLARRQKGPGRSKRQAIEKDIIQILSGLKGGVTLGSPIAMMIQNQDALIESLPNPTVPRPGHADLSGILKFTNTDIRAVLERASARETAARTAAGALAMVLLREFNMDVFAYVREIGGIVTSGGALEANAKNIRDASPFYSLDSDADAKFLQLIEAATAGGDSLGGIIEIVVIGAPAGLGSFMSSDLRLDGRLASALMSIPAVKGVEIGLGFDAARRMGSEVHDEICYDKNKPNGGFYRNTNRAGGLEGGMTNGEPVIVRIAMKPIPTMKKGARSVDLKTRAQAPATYQRSDVCSVPAASVVAESVVAFEIAKAFIEKFGGDTMGAMAASFNEWKSRILNLEGTPPPGAKVESP
ncbi:MAG: chorismate synthase [Planctomycetota bacterium]